MPIILKYVILRGHANDELALRLFPGTTQHGEIAVEMARTHAAISAGYVAFSPTGQPRTFGESTSLCLVPAPTDAAFIAAMLRATATTAPRLPELVA